VESGSTGAKIEAHMYEDDEGSNNAPQRNNDDIEYTPSSILSDEEIRRSLEDSFFADVNPWIQAVISGRIRIHRYGNPVRKKRAFGLRYELLNAISVAASRTYRYFCNNRNEFLRELAGEDLRQTLKLYHAKFPYLSGRITLGDDEGMLWKPDSIQALATGDDLGDGMGDIRAVVDIIEKTGGIFNKEMQDSTSIAVYVKGGETLEEKTSRLYMRKIIVGPQARDCGIDVSKSTEYNVERIARSLKKAQNELRCAILLRPCHYELINRLCALLGCSKIRNFERLRRRVEKEGYVKWHNIYLLNDGDVMATFGLFAPPESENHVDFIIGRGGFQEGLISAAIVKCMGGQMSAQLASYDNLNPEVEGIDLDEYFATHNTPEEHFSRQELQILRTKDPLRVRNVDGLIEGNDIVVTATAVKDSLWLPELKGIEIDNEGILTTHNLWLDSSGEILVIGIPYQTKITELLRQKKEEKEKHKLARINFLLACAYALLGSSGEFQRIAERFIQEALSTEEITELERAKYNAFLTCLEALRILRKNEYNGVNLCEADRLFDEALQNIEDGDDVSRELNLIAGFLSGFIPASDLVDIDRQSRPYRRDKFQKRAQKALSARTTIPYRKYIKPYEYIYETPVDADNYNKPKLISILLPVYPDEDDMEETRKQLERWIESIQKDLEKLPEDYDYEIIVCLNKHKEEAKSIVVDALKESIRMGVKITILETEKLRDLKPGEIKRNCKVSALDAMSLELKKRHDEIETILGRPITHYIHCSDDDITFKLDDDARKPKEHSNVYANIERLEESERDDEFPLKAVSSTPLAHRITFRKFICHPWRSVIGFISNSRRFYNYGPEAEVEQLYGGSMTMRFEDWPKQGIHEFGYDDCYLSCYFGIFGNEKGELGYRKAVTTNARSEMYHDDPDNLTALRERVKRDAKEAVELEGHFGELYGGVVLFGKYRDARVESHEKRLIRKMDAAHGKRSLIAFAKDLRFWLIKKWGSQIDEEKRSSKLKELITRLKRLFKKKRQKKVDHTIEMESIIADLEEITQQNLRNINRLNRSEDIELTLEEVYCQRRDPRKEISHVEMIKSFLMPEEEKLWLVVLGDAGYGKSSLAYGLVKDTLKNDKDIFPILIDTKNPEYTGSAYASVRSVDFEKIIMLSQYLESKGKRIVVIFDRADYAVATGNAKLNLDIRRLIQNSIKVITLIRPTEYEILLRDENLSFDKEEIRLELLSDEELGEFLKRYIEKLYGTDDENTVALIDRLKKNASFISLARHPLFLRMIFEIYYPNEVPEDMTEKHVYDEYWNRFVKGKSEKAPGEAATRIYWKEKLANVPITYDYVMRKREEVILMCAFEMLKKGSLTLNNLEIDRILDEIIYEDGIIPKEYIYVMRENLKESVLSSGVIIEDSPGQFSFFHQAFFDYAAAQAVLKDKDNPEWPLQKRIQAILQRDKESIRFPALVYILLESDDIEFNRAIINRMLSSSNIGIKSCALEAFLKSDYYDHLSDIRQKLVAILSTDGELRKILELKIRSLPRKAKVRLSSIINDFAERYYSPEIHHTDRGTPYRTSPYDGFLANCLSGMEKDIPKEALPLATKILFSGEDASYNPCKIVTEAIGNIGIEMPEEALRCLLRILAEEHQDGYNHPNAEKAIRAILDYHKADFLDALENLITDDVHKHYLIDEIVLLLGINRGLLFNRPLDKIEGYVLDNARKVLCILKKIYETNKKLEEEKGRIHFVGISFFSALQRAGEKLPYEVRDFIIEIINEKMFLSPILTEYAVATLCEIQEMHDIKLYQILESILDTDNNEVGKIVFLAIIDHPQCITVEERLRLVKAGIDTTKEYDSVLSYMQENPQKKSEGWLEYADKADRNSFDLLMEILYKLCAETNALEKYSNRVSALMQVCFENGDERIKLQFLTLISRLLERGDDASLRFLYDFLGKPQDEKIAVDFDDVKPRIVRFIMNLVSTVKHEEFIKKRTYYESGKPPLLLEALMPYLPDEIFSILSALSSHKDKETRKCVASFLTLFADIRKEEALAILLQMAQDANGVVSKTALSSIISINPENPEFLANFFLKPYERHQLDSGGFSYSHDHELEKYLEKIAHTHPDVVIDIFEKNTDYIDSWRILRILAEVRPEKTLNYISRCIEQKMDDNAVRNLVEVFEKLAKKMPKKFFAWAMQLLSQEEPCPLDVTSALFAGAEILGKNKRECIKRIVKSNSTQSILSLVRMLGTMEDLSLAEKLKIVDELIIKGEDSINLFIAHNIVSIVRPFYDIVFEVIIRLSSKISCLLLHNDSLFELARNRPQQTIDFILGIISADVSVEMLSNLTCSLEKLLDVLVQTYPDYVIKCFEDLQKINPDVYKNLSGQCYRRYLDTIGRLKVKPLDLGQLSFISSGRNSTFGLRETESDESLINVDRAADEEPLEPALGFLKKISPYLFKRYQEQIKGIYFASFLRGSAHHSNGNILIDSFFDQDEVKEALTERERTLLYIYLISHELVENHLEGAINIADINTEIVAELAALENALKFGSKEELICLARKLDALDGEGQGRFVRSMQLLIDNQDIKRDDLLQEKLIRAYAKLIGSYEGFDKAGLDIDFIRSKYNEVKYANYLISLKEGRNWKEKYKILQELLDFIKNKAASEDIDGLINFARENNIGFDYKVSSAIFDKMAEINSSLIIGEKGITVKSRQKDNVFLGEDDFGNKTVLTISSPQEIEILNKLDHPNIVKPIHYDPVLKIAVFEYLEGWETIYNAIYETPSMDKLLKLFSQLLDAVQYMHENKRIYGDIIHLNGLLSPDWDLLILDAGVWEENEHLNIENDLFEIGALLYRFFSRQIILKGAEIEDYRRLEYLPAELSDFIERAMGISGRPFGSVIEMKNDLERLKAAVEKTTEIDIRIEALGIGDLLKLIFERYVSYTEYTNAQKAIISYVSAMQKEELEELIKRLSDIELTEPISTHICKAILDRAQELNMWFEIGGVNYKIDRNLARVTYLGHDADGTNAIIKISPAREYNFLIDIVRDDVEKVISRDSNTGITIYEFIEGKNFGDFTEELPDLETLLELFIEMGKTSSALAALGIYQNDLDYRNILFMPDGTHKVIDFEVSTALSEYNKKLLLRGYGCTMYFVLTGMVFSRLMDFLKPGASYPGAKSPYEEIPYIHPALNQIIKKALEKSEDGKEYESIEEIIADLENLLKRIRTAPADSPVSSKAKPLPPGASGHIDILGIFSYVKSGDTDTAVRMLEASIDNGDYEVGFIGERLADLALSEEGQNMTSAGITVAEACREVAQRLGGEVWKEFCTLEHERIERVEVAIRSIRHGKVLFDPANLAQAGMRIPEIIRELPSDKNMERITFELKRIEINIRKITDKIGGTLGTLGLLSKEGVLTIHKTIKVCGPLSFGPLKEIIKELYALRSSVENIREDFNSNYNGKKHTKKILLIEFNNILAIFNAVLEKLESRAELATATSSETILPLDEIIKKFHSVTIEPEHLPPIRVKGNRLSLISAIANIINNGNFFAMINRGKEAAVKVSVTTEGGYVKIDITDNGGGIPQELLELDPSTGKPKLFVLNVSQRPGGAGLGLTETWYALKDMGGTIEVESEVGKGTTFTIRLPIADESSKATIERRQRDEDTYVHMQEERKRRFIEAMKEKGGLVVSADWTGELKTINDYYNATGESQSLVEFLGVSRKVHVDFGPFSGKPGRQVLLYGTTLLTFFGAPEPKVVDGKIETQYDDTMIYVNGELTLDEQNVINPEPLLKFLTEDDVISVKRKSTPEPPKPAQGGMVVSRREAQKRLNVDAAMLLQFRAEWLTPETIELIKNREFQLRVNKAWAEAYPEQYQIIEEWWKAITGLLGAYTGFKDAIILTENGKAGLIEITCNDSDGGEVGRSSVQVGDTQDVGYRVLGLLNLAFAGSNIPLINNSSQAEAHNHIIAFINEQYEALTGVKNYIDSSSIEDINKKRAVIEINLPPINRVDFNNELELNMAIETLRAV